VRAVTRGTTKEGREVDVVELESSDDGSASDEQDVAEARELAGGLESEKIPTSKQGFKQSPFYVVASVLNTREVLHPDAGKHISGVFKGELGKEPPSKCRAKVSRLTHFLSLSPLKCTVAVT
jgi:hypothetical protein